MGIREDIDAAAAGSVEAFERVKATAFGKAGERDERLTAAMAILYFAGAIDEIDYSALEDDEGQ